MKLTARIPVTAAFVAILLFGATGCNQLKSRDQLNKGVQAFKNARYEEAVDHFQTAIKLDPSSEDAKLYLAPPIPTRWFRISIHRRTWRWRRRR
jgi:tetratricopeptide (TPR) repeat protein